MKKQVRIVVAGGRDFNDYKLLRDTLDDLISEKYSDRSVIIVSGAAEGADKLGEKYAKERNCQIAQFKADWETHHHDAGHHRNKKMAEYAEPHVSTLCGDVEGALVAFWDGKSKGTRNMIQAARRHDLEIIKVKYIVKKAMTDDEQLKRLESITKDMGKISSISEVSSLLKIHANMTELINDIKNKKH